MVAAAVLLGACSSSGSSGPSSSAASSTSCSPSALNGVTAPVTINFWESMPRANGVTLAALTKKFNDSQTKVHVNLVYQTGYDDTWQKYQAGLTNGELPDVVQLQDINTQAAIDTQSLIPSQSCLDGFHDTVGDILPRALAYWNVNNVQWAMPFAVSGPILYYNKLAFQKAGLNPAQPPATLPELVTDAKALKAAGLGGMGLKVDPWHLETWLATDNQLFVNHDNGRTGRATGAVFNTPTGVQIFTELDQMVSGGAATTNAYVGAGAFDNLLGVGSGKYAMTIDTSAALGTIQQLLASGQYPNVQLGVGPFPKLSATSSGGVEPGGSALWISKRSSAAKRAAAWQYIAFLDATDSQATWAAGTGYIPLRTSSTQTALIQSLWARQPEFKVAYTQLTAGAQSYATAGAVVGPFAEVRTAIVTAESSMYVSGTSPSAALAGASATTNQLIQNYNQRLGVG